MYVIPALPVSRIYCWSHRIFWSRPGRLSVTSSILRFSLFGIFQTFRPAASTRFRMARTFSRVARPFPVWTFRYSRPAKRKIGRLSRMSHELRTPMNSILGFAQLLEEDKLSPDQSDSVEQILTSGRHLL